MGNLYLTPYRAALSGTALSQSKLRRLMAGNPQQQARLAVLDQATATKLDELEQTIHLRNASGLAAAVLQGQQEMNRIRRIADSF